MVPGLELICTWLDLWQGYSFDNKRPVLYRNGYPNKKLSNYPVGIIENDYSLANEAAIEL